MLTRLLPLVALPLLLSACGSATSTDTDTGEDAATSTTGAASGQDPVLVITDLGVFTIDKHGAGGMKLIELAPGVTLDDIKANTEGAFKVALAKAA